MSVIEPGSIRSEIADVLRELRSRIRRYVAMEGTALVVAVAGLAFWISLAADYGLELSNGVRRVLLVVTAAAIAGAGVWYLLLRLVRDFRNRSLALILERRFPQLNDRLITAVESAGAGVAPDLTATMLRQTADEAADLARRLQLGEVFNIGPLLRACALAALLVVSIAAIAFGSGEVVSTWFRRNILLADEFYRRETDLHVAVLAEPGERPMEFREGVYKHPRGGDLTLQATVLPGMTVPENVWLTYRNVLQRGGGNDTMTKIGQREFRHRLPGLHDSIRLWLSGGDYSTREALIVQVVEPPQIDRVTLECLYPEYTGLNARDESSAAPVRQSVPVLGTQVSLPAGTDFLLQASANKPLQSVRVQTDSWELWFDRERANFSPVVSGGAERGVAEISGADFLAADGRGFRLPLVLAAGSSPAASSSAAPDLPLKLSTDALLRITLHDEDDIVASEPARLAINSIPDQPPRVEVRPKGIGSSVTRQATIPVVGEIPDDLDNSIRYGVTDDYGIVEARFEYRIEGAADPSRSDWQPAPFAARPEGRRQFTVEERFSILPLDLPIGTRLALKVVAVDADNLSGPHVASGAMFNFQIVSDDELLAQIAVKELNIRRRFEQILDELRNTRKDLLLARTRLEEPAELKSATPAEGAPSEARPLASAAAAAQTAVERAISGTRKNANETQSIEEEFRDIRDELENNAIPDARPMLERLDQGIIRPLHSINTLDYNDLDDGLVVLLGSLEQSAGAASRFAEPVDRLNLTIDHMEAVLAQMLKLETVNEALQMLRDIIKAQEELQEKTRLERKKKLIEGLR